MASRLLLDCCVRIEPLMSCNGILPVLRRGLLGGFDSRFEPLFEGDFNDKDPAGLCVDRSATGVSGMIWDSSVCGECELEKRPPVCASLRETCPGDCGRLICVDLIWRDDEGASRAGLWGRRGESERRSCDTSSTRSIHPPRDLSCEFLRNFSRVFCVCGRVEAG